MSGQSVYKLAYDRYALEWFQSKGWDCDIVNKRGRYCDLIGVKGNELAIIEVKSPAETSCSQDYGDIKGMTPIQTQKLPKNFSFWRKEIFNGINNLNGLSLVKLFAVSMACQLCRYVYEYEFLKGKYIKATPNLVHPASPYRLMPFFVVPIEGQQQADHALTYLKNNNYIYNFSTNSSHRQYIINIEYHKTQNRQQMPESGAG